VLTELATLIYTVTNMNCLYIQDYLMVTDRLPFNSLFFRIAWLSWHQKG